MPSKRNQLPDRWLKYKNVGSVLQGTRFLPIKVPLNENFTTHFPESRFTSKDFLDLVHKKGLKVGLVIDLTFTSKYYKPDEFLQHGIQHHKIFMPGHVIPERRICDEFAATVKEFEKNNIGNDDLITVHCTHGLNRTGYLVCKYLIEEKKMKPKEAISLFNKARGHDMERQNYLNDLLTSSNSSKGELENYMSSSKTPDKHLQDYTRNHAYGNHWPQSMHDTPMTHYPRMQQVHGASYNSHSHKSYNDSWHCPQSYGAQHNFAGPYRHGFYYNNGPRVPHATHTYFGDYKPSSTAQERENYRLASRYSTHPYQSYHHPSRQQQRFQSQKRHDHKVYKNYY